MVKITLNGESKEIKDNMTVQTLLDELKITRGRVACELNREIVKRADFSNKKLQNGDSLEIVQMIGGG